MTVELYDSPNVVRLAASVVQFWPTTVGVMTGSAVALLQRVPRLVNVTGTCEGSAGAGLIKQRVWSRLGRQAAWEVGRRTQDEAKACPGAAPRTPGAP